MAHQKHTKLQKPIGGKFGRNEIAIMGAPCGEIKTLADQLIKELSLEYQIAYIDAEHNTPEDENWTALKSGAYTQYNNKIAFTEIQKTPDEHDDLFFNEADLVLINGNHYQSESQIVFVHPNKSVEHKLSKLTNVLAIILDDSISDVPDYLKLHLGELPPVLNANDINAILGFLTGWLHQRKPVLKGLVLAGGKSTRMGTDKSGLNFHGVPQSNYMSQLLEPYCEKVYLSARDEQQAQELKVPCIVDTFSGLGPYGGILSAFREDPNAAWLVVAIDLPFLDKGTMADLVENRNTHRNATCFIDRNDEYPEPLITIWEPRAYPVLLNFLSKGYSCPRKVLLNSPVEIIVNRDKKALTNVNTPEEHEYALTEITKTT